MDNFVNMTSHDINLVNSDHSELMTIKPSGNQLRVPRPKNILVSELTVGTAKVAVNRKDFTGLSAVVIDADGNETALPEPESGTYYIVSKIACEAMPERSDLLMVDGTIRNPSPPNGDGRIIGCTGFSVL